MLRSPTFFVTNKDEMRFAKNKVRDLKSLHFKVFKPYSPSFFRMNGLKTVPINGSCAIASLPNSIKFCSERLLKRAALTFYCDRLDEI